MLAAELWGDDVEWVENGQLVGMAAPDYVAQPDRGLSGQRGWR